MSKENIEEFLRLILGICDLPHPRVYHSYNGSLHAVYGQQLEVKELEACRLLQKEQVHEFSLNRSEEISQLIPSFNFILSINLDPSEEERIFVFDQASKSINKIQKEAISSLIKLYKKDMKSTFLIKESERQKKGIELLNQIKSDTRKNLDDRLYALLNFCTEYLGLESGVISTISGDTYKVIQVYPEAVNIQAGQTFKLSETYCDITAEKKKAVAIDKISKSEYANHICYKKFKRESYIGAWYESEHRKGVVSFSSAHAKEKPFTSFDTDFVQLVANMVGAIIEEEKLNEALRKEKNMLYSFVKSAPAAVAMFDRDIKYLVTSQKWIQDYNIDRNILGISYYEIFPEVGDEWKEVHKRALQGDILKSEEEKFERADGSVQWIKWEVKPWYNIENEVAGIVMFTDDITEQVKQQEAVKLARIETEKAAKLKEQFAYIASHDLQEPVRTILTLAKMLKEGSWDQLDEKSKKMVTYMYESASRMKKLIKGLLDFSRIGKNKMLEKTDLNILLDNVIKDLNNQIEVNNASILNEGLPTIKVYKTELRSLLQNLITNAIKFSRPDENPVVEISSKKAANKYIISIKDNGIGIDEEYRERIFQIFQRLNAPDAFEGQGLGLAHCKRIAEIHRGDIWVEPNEGHGSTFKFTIDKNLDSLPEVFA